MMEDLKMDYEKQAKDFLQDFNAEMIIKPLGKQIAKHWNDGKLRNTFSVTIKRDGKKYNFKFYGNLIGDPITEYDVLAAVQKYDVGTFEDFTSEFGYDYETTKEYNRIKKLYEAVQEEYANIENLFGDCMDELSEIA
jgi:hypothetical protein